jgi:hypothetical protein
LVNEIILYYDARSEKHKITVTKDYDPTSHIIEVVVLDVQIVLHFIGALGAHRDVLRQKVLIYVWFLYISLIKI